MYDNNNVSYVYSDSILVTYNNGGLRYFVALAAIQVWMSPTICILETRDFYVIKTIDGQINYFKIKK